MAIGPATLIVERMVDADDILWCIKGSDSEEFRFAEQISLYPVDIKQTERIEFFCGFNGLCENPDIHTVCRICERSDKELIIGFKVDVAGVAAIYFQIADFETAQVAEGVETAAEMIDSAAAAERRQSVYDGACVGDISENTGLGKLESNPLTMPGMYL